MKVYQLETKIHFGKHLGNSIETIIQINPYYLCWCLTNLDHFHLSENAWELLRKKIVIKEDVRAAWQQKEDEINVPVLEIEQDSYSDWDDDYGTSGEKYGWYNGWSDDAIDDAFEGDPEATWNVD